METKKKGVQTTSATDHSVTLGEYAHAMICEQYQAVVKQEKKVLADKNPEHLHHMRVGMRRLRTALQVFDLAVELPKASQVKRLGSTAKVLGRLRDLDVQLADVESEYRPRVSETEQRSLDQMVNALHRQRRKAFTVTKKVLHRSRYQNLKRGYETWINQPQFTALAQLPLLPLLPDLLSPLLSTLLLHQGWLVSPTDLSEETNLVLHDLRKACKHVRYQAEFFVPFYGADFKNWIEEIKTLQASLGKVHDSQVLAELLAKYLPEQERLATLHETIQQIQFDQMATWKPLQQKYLDRAFRHHLHEMLLKGNFETQPLLVTNDSVNK